MQKVLKIINKKLQRGIFMAGFEKGTKRLCQECEVKFYDLNRDPIICPACGKEFIVETTAAPKEKEEPKAEEEVVTKTETTPETSASEADIISLDEADEEIQGSDEEIPDDIDDVEVDENMNADQQDTFLEVDDEDADKVDLGIATDLGDE